ADDWRFAGTDTACSSPAAALIPMPVFCQPADESFIDFDNSAELVNVLHERYADAMAHIPSRFQRTKSHIAPNLPSTHTLLASEHQMDNAIPIAQRLLGIFKYGPGKDREPITARRTFMALPVPFAGSEIIDGRIAATWAANAFRPASGVQVRLASLFVWKHFLELCYGQLVNLWRLFSAGHWVSLPILKGH